LGRNCTVLFGLILALLATGCSSDTPGPSDQSDAAMDADASMDVREDGGDACEQRCGLCNLGRTECGGGAACVGPLQELAPVDSPSSLDCGTGLLFVDTDYGGNDPDGTRSAPFTDLQTAITAAESQGASAIIVGGSPIILDVVTLTEGVSVYGGFDRHPTFLPNPQARPSIQVEASTALEGSLIGVIARDITARTVFSGFEIDNPDLNNQNDVSNIGAYLYNAPALTLHRMRILAGDAGDGSDGADGQDSEIEGTDGKRGDAAEFMRVQDQACSQSIMNAGGEAGEPASQCEFLSRLTLLGAGGDGATGDLEGNAAGDDAPTGAQGGRADPGEDGTPREPADNGTNGGLVLRIESDARPRATGYGGSGNDGLPGRGGAGGAAGNGDSQELPGTNETNCYWGAGGGGGGGGGCGGEGGDGGEAGGWSVGIASANSDGFVIFNSTIQAAAGGDGGGGGRGGIGAAGGEGGPGGFGTSTGTGSSAGEPGGDGTAGQEGGDGANGTGGASYAVWCDDSTSVDLQGEDNELTAGTAGQGGTSDRTDLPQGRPGEAGRTQGCR